MRLALLGFGLVGGSIARAVAGIPAWSIRAWTPTGAGPAAAAADGLVEAASTLWAALEDAELVVLAGPPLACLELVDQLGGPLRDALPTEAVVTDVASTKAAIVDRARSVGLRFVGGHPMAGRETSGFAAAEAELFRDRPWVVVPPRPPDDDAEARVVELARACGARPVRLGAADHDEAVAAISHLPLVVAAALVEAVAGGRDGSPPPGWPLAASLAAGGWASATRVARGDPTMGAGILATNAGPVAERLRALRATLDAWLNLLDDPAGPGPDADALEARLAAARRRLGSE